MIEGLKISPKRINHEANQWYHCCFTHDIAYWAGGEEQEKVNADYHLDFCVSEATFGAHGTMMRLGVEMGGLPNTGLPWRWGYGFAEDRSYKKMNMGEKIEAFQKFDGILDRILDMKDLLEDHQKSYMLGRYEYVRHTLAEQLELSYEEETKNFDERLEKVNKILD